MEHRNIPVFALRCGPFLFKICSVLHPDLLSLYQFVGSQLLRVQIGMVHVHRGNLAVLIGRVIINSPVQIAAGAVNRILADRTAVRIRPKPAAAFLLLYRPENLEKLTDARGLRLRSPGIPKPPMPRLYVSSVTPGISLCCGSPAEAFI